MRLQALVWGLGLWAVALGLQLSPYQDPHLGIVLGIGGAALLVFAAVSWFRTHRRMTAPKSLPKGPRGAGGHADASQGGFAMGRPVGREGGEATQSDRGGRGGRPGHEALIEKLGKRLNPPSKE